MTETRVRLQGGCLSRSPTRCPRSQSAGLQRQSAGGTVEHAAAGRLETRSVRGERPTARIAALAGRVASPNRPPRGPGCLTDTRHGSRRCRADSTRPVQPGGSPRRQAADQRAETVTGSMHRTGATRPAGHETSFLMDLWFCLPALAALPGSAEQQPARQSPPRRYPPSQPPCGSGSSPEPQPCPVLVTRLRGGIPTPPLPCPKRTAREGTKGQMASFEGLLRRLAEEHWCRKVGAAAGVGVRTAVRQRLAGKHY